MKLLIFFGLITRAIQQQQDSITKDNTVFPDTQPYDEQRVQVSMQTTSNDLPEGHMKQLGEHAEPVMGEITELNYMISGKDFYENFARKRKPVIFRGVTRNWRSTKQWKNESYLLENYPDVLFDVETGKVYDAALHTRETMTMRQFLSEYKNRTLYLDSPFPQTAMMADVEMPLMLQCEEKYKQFTSMHLLFSNGSTSSPLHHDGYENFLSLFSGVKVAFMIAPKYGKELYVEFVEDFPGLSPINPQAVDFEKYPLFKDVPFHKVVINPGDMLYIPQFWYHQVRSYQSPNIAATMWFSLFEIPNMEDMGFREVLNIADKFDVGVNAATETIECLHQNRPMNDVLDNDHVNFKEFDEKAKASGDEEEMNWVDLYDEVLPDQPTIFAGSDDTHIYAVDMLTGKTKWRIKTLKDTGSMCAFSHDNTLVYCGADDGYMRAINIQNGTVLWQYQASGAIISSVQLDDKGNLYFGCLDHYMYSIDENGKKRWRRFLGDQIWSTPLLFPDADILVIGTKVGDSSQNRSNAFGLEMSSGRFVWRFKTAGGIVASPRLSANGVSVFICSVTGWLYELEILEGNLVNKVFLNTTSGEELWSTPAVHRDGTVFIVRGAGIVYAYDSGNQHVKWEIDLTKFKDKGVEEDDRGSNSSPLIGLDGYLYVGAGFGTVFAIDPVTAQIKWHTRIGTGIFFSSPRLSKDGVLYVGALDGALVALDSRTGNEVWRHKTDGPFVGTALITEGFS